MTTEKTLEERVEKSQQSSKFSDFWPENLKEIPKSFPSGFWVQEINIRKWTEFYDRRGGKSLNFNFAFSKKNKDIILKRLCKKAEKEYKKNSTFLLHFGIDPAKYLTQYRTLGDIFEFILDIHYNREEHEKEPLNATYIKDNYGYIYGTAERLLGEWSIVLEAFAQFFDDFNYKAFVQKNISLSKKEIIQQLVRINKDDLRARKLQYHEDPSIRRAYNQAEYKFDGRFVEAKKIVYKIKSHFEKIANKASENLWTRWRIKVDEGELSLKAMEEYYDLLENKKDYCLQTSIPTHILNKIIGEYRGKIFVFEAIYDVCKKLELNEVTIENFRDLVESMNIAKNLKPDKQGFIDRDEYNKFIDWLFYLGAPKQQLIYQKAVKRILTEKKI